MVISCNNTQDAKSTNTSDGKPKDSVIENRVQKSDTNLVQFKKHLELQGIKYDLNAIGSGSSMNLTIVPSGLKGHNDSIVLSTDSIVGAEVEDLDRDGFPELLIYTKIVGSGSNGSVIGFSPNKGKSLSQIYFPELDKTDKAMKDYRGQDEFAIVESSLIRRFKCYQGSDSNVKPTGIIRQLEYKLQPGEASKKFVLMKFSDIASL
jgi:hypothetical protein